VQCPRVLLCGSGRTGSHRLQDLSLPRDGLGGYHTNPGSPLVEVAATETTTVAIVLKDLCFICGTPLCSTTRLQRPCPHKLRAAAGNCNASTCTNRSRDRLLMNTRHAGRWGLGLRGTPPRPVPTVAALLPDAAWVFFCARLHGGEMTSGLLGEYLLWPRVKP
jgi:hypothetical protein